MKTYYVTITAKIRKTIRVNAENEYQAEEFAHEAFDVNCTANEEAYDQETNTIEVEA